MLPSVERLGECPCRVKGPISPGEKMEDLSSKRLNGLSVQLSRRRPRFCCIPWLGEVSESDGTERMGGRFLLDSEAGAYLLLSQCTGDPPAFSADGDWTAGGSAVLSASSSPLPCSSPSFPNRFIRAKYEARFLAARVGLLRDAGLAGGLSWRSNAPA